MSALLPEGVTHLGDCPYPLHQLIVSTLRVLKYEEFPSDERPPKKIWLRPEAMEGHWEEVERKRKAKWDPKHADDPEIDEDFEPQTNAVELITRG